MSTTPRWAGPVYGDRPDRADVEALLRRRINTALHNLRDGDDWRDRFTVRPILRHVLSTTMRPYRLRQWIVLVDDAVVGYVETGRNYDNPALTRMTFRPRTLPPEQYEIDTAAETIATSTGHAVQESS